jgi:ketosteroid isomerase-like protein
MEKAEQQTIIKELRLNIATCDRLIQEEKFSELATYYTKEAVLVVKPDLRVTGREQIAQAFEKIAAYFDHSLKPVEGKMDFLIAGDTALVLAQTFVEASDQAKANSEYAVERRATYVFRLVSGNWLCALDNSYGTSLLD